MRVTSAVRPSAAGPGAGGADADGDAAGGALLQLVTAAEAAKGALPVAAEPSSPPRAQIRPTG